MSRTPLFSSALDRNYSPRNTSYRDYEFLSEPRGGLENYFVQRVARRLAFNTPDLHNATVHFSQCCPLRLLWRSHSWYGAYSHLLCLILTDICPGFYQYGTVTWAMFFQWLATLVTSVEPYIILHGDRFDSEQYFSTDAIVMPGKYTLLAAGMC